jgi:tape measure domain-containing protein
MVDNQQDPEILELGADASDLVSAAAQVDALASSIERLQAAVSVTSSPSEGSAERQIKSLQELAAAFVALDEVRKTVGPGLESFATGLGKDGLKPDDFSGELDNILLGLAKFEKELKRVTASDPGNAQLKAEVDRRLAVLREFKDRAIKTMTDGDGVGAKDFISTLLGSRGSGSPLKGIEAALIADIKGLASSPGIRDALRNASGEIRKSIDQEINSVRNTISTKSSRLEREPGQMREGISREGSRRRLAAERQRIADLERRAAEAASDARRDPEIQRRVFGTQTSDESQAIRIAKDRESRLREVGEATRKANEEAQRLREEQAILKRNLEIARDNESALSPEEQKADVERRFAAGDSNPRIYRTKIPGLGPEYIKEVERRLEENSRLLTAARARQSTATRELSDFLSADPLDGLKLPKSVDPAKLKKIIADRMLQTEIARITRETGSAPDAGTIEEFRSFISQQGTGAAAKLAQELITERQSSSPLFDRAQRARASKRGSSAASASSGKTSPSGLDAQGIYIEKDLKTMRAERDDAAKRLLELTRAAQEAKDRLSAVRAAAEDVLGEDELEMRDESRGVRSATPRGGTEGDDDSYDATEVVREADRSGRSAVGTGEEGDDVAKEIKSDRTRLTVAEERKTIEFYERQIALFMKEQVAVMDEQGNQVFKEKKTIVDGEEVITQEPVMKTLTREEAIEIIAEEFDATYNEIAAMVGPGKGASAAVDDAFIDEAAKRLAGVAKNKILRDEGRGLTGPEINTLKGAIRRALKAMILGDDVKPKDADALIANLIFKEVEDTFNGTGIGAQLSGDNRSLPGGAGGRQTSSDMDRAIEKAGVLGRADAESAATGRSKEDIIRATLDDAEQRATEAAQELVAAQAALRELQAQVDNPMAGTSRFFEILGITDKRMGGADPLDLLAGRTSESTIRQRRRARSLSARVPFGFAAVSGSALAGRNKERSSSPDGNRAAEQVEGTVGVAGLPENPVFDLFRRKRVVSNTEAGAAMNTTSIKPAEAEAAIQFLKELFESTRILTADMASLLAEGKSVKQSDIDDLSSNLGLMKVAYDQIAELKSSNPAAAAAIASLTAQFDGLAKDPAVQRLFSPEFIGRAVPAGGGFAASEAGVIRKTDSLDEDAKLSLARELIAITKALESGGDAVVAGMERFGEVQTGDEPGSGAARLPRSGRGAPESIALSAQAISGLATEIMTSGRRDADAAKKELTALIAELIARGDLIPADLIGLIDDPALAKEISDAASKNVPSLRMERIPTKRAGVISRELYGEAARFDEATGEVIPAVPSRYQRQFEPGYEGPKKLESDVQEEIRQKVSQAIGKDISLEQLKQMATESFVVGYKTDEKGEVIPGSGRTVQDLTKSREIVGFVEKVLALEEVILGLAENIKNLFEEGEIDTSARGDEEAADVADAKEADASLASSKLAVAESTLRIAEMRRARASGGLSGPQALFKGEGMSGVSEEMNREAEAIRPSDINLDAQNEAISRDIDLSARRGLTDLDEFETELALADSFQRVRTVEDLESFGPDALNALAFSALPTTLVAQLIQDNPEGLYGRGGLEKHETENNPIQRLTDKEVKHPKNGLIKVSRDAAVAVLEALNKAGVRISIGKFSDEDGKEQLVSTMHLGEKLEDDKHATVISGIIAKEITRNGTSGNALTTISTPQFISHSSRDADEAPSSRGGTGGIVTNTAGIASTLGVTGGGVIRNIQIPRKVVHKGKTKLSQAKLQTDVRGTAGHEFGHTITSPSDANAHADLRAALVARMERMGIEPEHIASVLTNYANNSPYEALAEAYRIMGGYFRNNEEKEVALGKDNFGSSGIIAAAYSMVEMAKQATARTATKSTGYARVSGFSRVPEEAETEIASRLPGAGSISTETSKTMFSDVMPDKGASYQLQGSADGSPIVTENTPQTGFMVGGMQRYNLNVPASEVVPLTVPGNASDEEIEEIKQENNRRRQKFQAAVQKIIAENAIELKTLLAEGQEIYLGSWVEGDKVAIDITQRIPYLEGDAKGRKAALGRAMEIGKTRKQQSLAEITPDATQGRGTGAGYGATAFPETGIKNPDAMSTQRTYLGDEIGWSEEQPGELSAPLAMAAGDSGGSVDDAEFEKTLIQQIQDDPSSEQAKNNYAEFLELTGVASDEIARRVAAASGVVQATTAAADATEGKAEATEKIAQEAEDELGLFEDFDEDEYTEDGFMDDDTSNTSEIVEEIKSADQRTEDATERVADAKEEIAVATEEVATAVEEQAGSVQAASDAVSSSTASEVPAEAINQTSSRVQEIDAEIAAIDAKRAELQEKLNAAFAAQRDAAASVRDKLNNALATLDDLRMETLADELVSIELAADKEMQQREARFRRTEKGSRVNRKTGEYVSDFVPEVYGPDSEEYKELIAQGFSPDKDNAFGERDRVFAQKSEQFRYKINRPSNLAEQVGMPSVPGGETAPLSIEDLLAYLKERSGSSADGPSQDEVDAATAALVEFREATDPASQEIRTLNAEIRSLNSERERIQANRETAVSSGDSANQQAARADRDAILQKQIIPDQLSPIIDLLNKTIAIADQKLKERGIDTSGLTAKDKALALGDTDKTGQKLEYLIRVIEEASKVMPNFDAGGGVFLPKTVLPKDTTGKTPEAKLKSASKITGMLPNEVSVVAGVIERISASLKSLEAQAATGEVDLEALAASLQNVSSEARETAAFLVNTTTSDQQKIVAAGGGPGGGGGGKQTGGPSGPMDDPSNDWRKIRAVIPDTENISRGVNDLAALQNRFAELSPAIVHAAGSNSQFGKSLEDSAKKAQVATETLQRLTDANVGILKTVKTQVGRAATFLVLQQMGREIGGIFEHLQSGVFQFNQVLENTTVGFNTLFANTLQARAAVGNALVPKLNEAGVQIGFMREQAVKFSDAINYTKGAAEGMVAEIRNIANVTPFRFKPLVEAALKMKAFGFEATEIPGMINSISNAVAALGGEDEKIDRIAYALGQMNSAGRVYQNDMMQLANAGIAGYRMLSEKLLMDLTAMKMRALGTMKDIPEETAAEFDKLQGMLNSASFKKSFGSIDDMIRTLEDPKRAEGLIRNLAKRGFLIGSTAARAITEGMDRQYQGSADRLSRTMTGALSTIADLSQNFMATAFQPLFNSVRDTIVEVGQFMLKSREITKFVDDVRVRMQTFISSLASFGPALEAVGQIFINVFVKGLASAGDSANSFGAAVIGVVGKLGPGLKLIGDILANDVGRGLAVASLAFSLFSKLITSNPLIATVTVLVAAISGIAEAIQNNTLFVGDFVKSFMPAIEQLIMVIGEGIGTILEAFSGGSMTGFIAGLSVAINALMPLLTIFLTTMSVLLKVITPIAGPLGFIVGLFIAFKTAMMAYNIAGTLIGKVMNGLHDAWGSVNGAIDSQIDKVRKTAAAYDELKRAKIEAEDFKTNDRGQLLDKDNMVTTDKSKAAVRWGEGEKINSYGMTDFKGRAAQRALEGTTVFGRNIGLLSVDRARQRATDQMQNTLKPNFGEGFYMPHGEGGAPHTSPVITNKGIEGTYDYLNLADEKKAQFEKENKDAIAAGTLDDDQKAKYQNLQEASRLRQQASASGMFRFAGLDLGKTDTEGINDDAGAYSLDNMMSAVLVQRETSTILNETFAQLEAAGKKIVAAKARIEEIRKKVESKEMDSDQGAKAIASLEASIDDTRRSQADNMSIVGGLAEAGVPIMTRDKTKTDAIQSQVTAGKLTQADADKQIAALPENVVDPTQAKKLKVDDFADRAINIPSSVAAGIKKLPENVQNIVMAAVTKRYAEGKVFASKSEEEAFIKGILGDARGDAAIKASTVGIFGRVGQAAGNLFKKVQDKMPKALKRTERGGGKTGLAEIDTRDGEYYYVDEETGALGQTKVSAEELKKRERLRGPLGGMAQKMRGMSKAIGMAGAAAGLAAGARRLAGEMAPIMTAPIIGPLMEMLPKEMTNVLKQKAGPFQAMAQGIGTTAGAMLGQALIPIPGLGAALGGMIGGALAEFVGSAVDKAIAGSEEAIRQKKALMEEAKILGFTSEQAKQIAREKFAEANVPDWMQQGGAIPGINEDPTDQNPIAILFDAYTVGEKKITDSMVQMSDEEYNRRLAAIETSVPESERAGRKDALNLEREQRQKGLMDDDEYQKRKNDVLSDYTLSAETVAAVLKALDEERGFRSGANAFDQKQADFMNKGMDYETLIRYTGEEEILAQQNLAIMRKENETALGLIDGKIQRGEKLSDSEQALIDRLHELEAAAANSPIGLFGTLIDPTKYSGSQIISTMDNPDFGRSRYSEADEKAGVTDESGNAVKEGQQRKGYTDLETLLKNSDIKALTAAAGFSNAADALRELGFDYSKVTKDTSNLEFMQMVKDTLRVGVQARTRGDELMPKVDMTLTRLEMMERYGGEAGYKMFDQYAGDRAAYRAADANYQKLGGDARIGLLQEIQSQALPARYIVQGKNLGRDQVGGQDASGTAVRYGPENLLTVSEEAELKKLTAAQKERTAARYKDLTATLQIRMSTMGATAAEVAEGVAAEKAYANFRTTNQEKLAAALAAGTKATAEQLALLKEDTETRDKAYKTQTVSLQVGDALQAAEAAGLAISDKELVNNVALQKILLLKQRLIEANGGAALSMVASQAAEAAADAIILEIAAKKVALGDIELKQQEASNKFDVAKAKYDDALLKSGGKRTAEVISLENALNDAGRGMQALGADAARVQSEIDALTKKAAKFQEDAAKANPMKLTKKEIEEIKKLIAQDPGSILGGDGGSAANKALEKSLDLLNKISSVAAKAYERMRKEQQRTHDEYVKQLDEQEKRINERYKQRSDIQTEENLQAQLQISGLQMRSASADPLEAAKSFYDSKQALEQFYIDQQRDAELKVISDEKERYEKQYGESSEATQAIYDAALVRLNSRFDFAQSVLNGDEKMAGKMNDALRMTMLGNNFDEANVSGGVRSTEDNTAFKDYSNSAISIALQKQYKVQTTGQLYKKYTAIAANKRTTAQKNLISKYNGLLAAARKETAINSMVDAVSGGLTGEQDITMATNAEQDLAAFESSNRDAIAAALAANENITTEQEDLLAQLSEMKALAEAAQGDALSKALGSIGRGTVYNGGDKFEAKGGGFTGGIKDLTYGGAAVTGANVEDVLKVYQGSTEESGLAATFLNEARMAGFRYKDDQTGKEYAGAGNILAYLTELVNKMGGGSLGISKLNAEQGALYQYLMSLVSAKNTFTTAQKTAILAQRTLEQGLNDFEQATGVDINIANLAEADVTDKQFTEYFNALGKTFEDNAARDEAIKKMRDVLRDTYGQALLSVDVEQYAKFADSSDDRIGTLSGVAKSLKDVMDQIDNVMSSPNKMTSLDKLLFGADFDPNNLSGSGAVSNLKFGKTQIEAVTTAVAATRDAFESSMNSIKSYAAELSGPLGSFNQQSVTGADALTAAMGQTASSFSLATSKVNEYATALAAAAAARASLGVDSTLATGLATGTTPTGTVTAGANNTFNITVSNASGMDAQQLAAELARLIALQAGSSVK